MSHKFKQLFISSRPISWVNTAYPFAAAYLILSHTVDATLVIGALYFLIPYNVLMYGINDVFDYESDMRNPRKGGIEGAVLAKDSHRFVIMASILMNLPFVIYLGLQGSWASKLFLVFLIFMQFAYTVPGLRFKEKPFLDSFTSATHFVSPMIYGMLLVGWQPGLWPYIVAFYLWGMASHAFGAVQDIIPDKEAKIGSIATVIGGANTVRLAAGAYAVSFVVLALQGWPVIVAGICNLFYLANVLPFVSIKDSDSEKANKGWKRFIKLNWLTGFIITLLIILTWS